jgi:Pseudouridylate synthase
MKRAAAYIVGRHDFACFEASGSTVKNTVRTVYAAEVTENGNNIIVTISGNGFLYNMVRIIAGTLLDVGKGKIDADDVPSIIAEGDRTRAGKTLPAHGLCLISVEY